jgi:hypothetical protein
VAKIRPKLQRLLDADPEAFFLLRVGLETIGEGMRWWRELHPEELEVWGDGQTDTQSYASLVWREEATAFLRELIAYLRSIPEGERVIGYQPAAGHSGEWVKESAMENHATDYSLPMLRAFRSWLARKYGHLYALREAWKDTQVMFHTAEIPSPVEQETASIFHFRDPSRERKTLDYYEFLADLVAEDVIHFCRTIKETTECEALAGVFYGYLMELAWSNGWFNQRHDMEHPAYQRSGHLALTKVLASPYVDFLASPYSYGFRGLGGDGTFMSVTESIRRHGILYFCEEDTRTYLFPPHSRYGQAKDLPETVSILTRNFGNVLTHASGAWWADWHTAAGSPYRDPELMALIQRFMHLGERSLDLDRSPMADVAVIVDEESFFHERLINHLDWPLVYRQRHGGLARMGLPYDLYLLSDLERLPKDYKCYLFLNTFRLDDAEREVVKQVVRREGRACPERSRRVAVWMFASGLIHHDVSARNMEDLTGLRFGLDWTEWGLNLLVTGFDHPLTRDLPAHTHWGTDFHVGPIPYVDDPDATVLGTLVYTQGSGMPGMAVKAFDGWTSIYVGAPNVPSTVLRSLAAYAGAHVFCYSDDVLHASRHFLALHTTKAEEKRLFLPYPAHVYEVIEDRPVAEGVTEFTDFVAAGETKLYYYGEEPW